MISLKKICITLVVALLFLVPAQYADAAIDASTLKKLFDQVDNESKWRTSSNKPDGYEITYTDGYVMRAYLLMYQSTGDKQYLNKFISFADSVLARRDNVVGKTDFRGLRLPGWSSNHFDPKQNMHYAMATGIIATPLAQFATVVKSDPALANYKTKANIYVQAAKDAMAIHDKPSNSQYIYSDNNWIEDSNTLYLRRPVNMNVAYGSALLAIYEATGDKAYYDKGKKIANYFKPLLTVNPSTSGYYWKYFPGHSSYGNVIEDLSHSTLGAEFAYLAYKNGIYNSTDMQRLANTANKTLAKSNGSVANRLDGSGVSTQPGLYLHWLWFEPWAPSILDKAYNIVKSRTSTYPMELTGIAMLNYFNSHGDVPAPGPDPEPDPDPEPTPPTDTQRPVVKINAPASGGQLNGTAVFQVSASDNVGVDNLVLGYGPSANGPWTEVKGASELKSGTDASGNWQLSWDVSGLKDGTYYVLARATDAAGNMGFSTPFSYEVKNTVPDTQRPVVKITAPASGAQLNGTAVFQVTASDNVGVDNLVLGYGPSANGPWTEVKGTSELKSGTDASGNWQLSWDVSGLKDGTYYVLARATDAAGNMGFSTPFSYEVKNTVPDTQRPVVKITAPASGAQLNGTAVFQVTASDNVGVDNLVLGYGPSANGPWTEVKGASELKSGTDASGNWQLNWDVSGLKDGTYYVLAKAIDAAGNMGFSAPLTYEVKNQAQAPAPAGNLIENGDFSAGLQGWLNKNNSAKISRDSSGNPALTNTFNYDFFQEINLQPGNYKLNARTYAGTSQKAAMIVIMFYHRDGSHTTDYVFKHQHTGKGWQSINEMNIKVPATVVKARIFLTVESGDNGYHHFDDVTLTAVK
ncbi:Ig-like domain-containing protein [Desulfoscipio gibsoniae]|uniref:Ig-like domain-containing protein n=1 Tax=Desulfoscipio gibsoniae DSM 7213 TaxID=767817 RepID=R4KL53_9FIRM|nr:Ig-like domain-containing protein [Desulfoscipio gibsoniae]AGL03389.1 hypothetical protein Desgi_4134 [Desulfoscipio gibsoniae DSM 7213]